MRPPLTPDHEREALITAFVSKASPHLDAAFRAAGTDLPPGASEQLVRVIMEYHQANVGEDKFLNVSSARILDLVTEAAKEIPGGRSNPQFVDLLLPRVRALMKEGWATPR